MSVDFYKGKEKYKWIRSFTCWDTSWKGSSVFLRTDCFDNENFVYFSFDIFYHEEILQIFGGKA